MRLVIFGLTVSSSWGNGHATIWRGLCRALARKGHQVRFFERDVPYYAAHRDLQNSEPYQLILYSAWEEVEAQAREAVAAADSAIVTSYCPDALAAADLILDSPALVRVFYDLDTPVTLERLRPEGGRWTSYGSIWEHVALLRCTVALIPRFTNRWLRMLTITPTFPTSGPTPPIVSPRCNNSFSNPRSVFPKNSS